MNKSATLIYVIERAKAEAKHRGWGDYGMEDMFLGILKLSEIKAEDMMKGPEFFLKIVDIEIHAVKILFSDVYKADTTELRARLRREMKHVDVDPYREKLAESFRYKGFSRCTLSSLRHTILRTKKSTGFFIEAAKLNIPTLCLWGRDDITMPFYMSGRFREIMPGAEFHELDGSGHIFVYDEVEKAAQWTLPFLKNNTEA